MNLKLTFCTILFTVLLSTSRAAEKDFSPLLGVEGTGQEVIALVERAARYFESNTLEDSADAFTSKKFLIDDLYVFVFDNKGTVVIHGVDPAFEGVDFFDKQDTEGSPFMQRFLEIDKHGWVSYYWRHPLLGRIMKKNTYVLRVSDEYLIGAGYYIE